MQILSMGSSQVSGSTGAKFGCLVVSRQCQCWVNSVSSMTAGHRTGIDVEDASSSHSDTKMRVAQICNLVVALQVCSHSLYCQANNQDEFAFKGRTVYDIPCHNACVYPPAIVTAGFFAIYYVYNNTSKPFTQEPSLNGHLASENKMCLTFIQLFPQAWRVRAWIRSRYWVPS